MAAMNQMVRARSLEEQENSSEVGGGGGGGGGISQNLSSVTNDSFCYKLLKSLLLIGYQIFLICH